MRFRKKLSCVNKLLSDFKEGKRFPSKSRCTSFNFNAGMSQKKCVISEKNALISLVIALPRIDTLICLFHKEKLAKKKHSMKESF